MCYFEIKLDLNKTTVFSNNNESNECQSELVEDLCTHFDKLNVTLLVVNWVLVKLYYFFIFK